MSVHIMVIPLGTTTTWMDQDGHKERIFTKKIWNCPIPFWQGSFAVFTAKCNGSSVTIEQFTYSTIVLYMKTFKRETFGVTNTFSLKCNVWKYSCL